MCSLINKQLLLTAYAYLFITEQQKGQQGSESLQLEKMQGEQKKESVGSKVCKCLTFWGKKGGSEMALEAYHGQGNINEQKSQGATPLEKSDAKLLNSPTIAANEIELKSDQARMEEEMKVQEQTKRQQPEQKEALPAQESDPQKVAGVADAKSNTRPTETHPDQQQQASSVGNDMVLFAESQENVFANWWFSGPGFASAGSEVFGAFSERRNALHHWWVCACTTGKEAWVADVKLAKDQVPLKAIDLNEIKFAPLLKKESKEERSVGLYGRDMAKFANDQADAFADWFAKTKKNTYPRESVRSWWLCACKKGIEAWAAQMHEWVLDEMKMEKVAAADRVAS